MDPASAMTAFGKAAKELAETVGVEGIIKQLCVKMVAAAPGRLRIAEHKADTTCDKEPAAHEFLKLDDTRAGRDFKLYGFMADINGDGFALADFAAIVMHIRVVLPEVFEAVREDVINGWAEHVDENRRDDWRELWGETQTEPAKPKMGQIPLDTTPPIV